MKGKLYGIGTGPGDPELLTLKAISTIEKCDVVAVPNGGSGDKTAFSIVEKYISKKTLLECTFSMERNEEKRKEMRLQVADEICKVLERGKTIGFITLGDPTIYSTYMYVHKIVIERGFETEIISGIPSFVAVAAALNTSLCEGEEHLHIISGNTIEDFTQLKGNKVIMKSGKSLKAVLKNIEEKGLSNKTKIIERCGLEGQRIFNSIEEFNNAEDVGYFAIAVVKG